MHLTLSHPVRFNHYRIFQDLAISWHAKLPENKSLLFQPFFIPGSIIRAAGYYFQIVPRADWASQKKLFAIIPSSSVWSVKLPAQLGNQSSHCQLLKALMKYNAPHPEFVKFDSKDNSSRKDFNFGDFRKSADLRIAIETVLWGWPARHLFEKRMLEYYLVYRHLCFARSMAILREHILLSINDLLGRVNFPSHLILKGLPTSDEFDKAIHELELGKISFRDALNLANFL